MLFKGVDSVSMDVKNLTVIGDIDLVCILSKLRKLCNTEIVSVGPAKEPEMKDDEKKMKDDEKKPYANAVPPYYSYNAVPPNYYYNVDSAEEKPGPNACVIS